jgi:DNA-binding protein HU-beta
MNKGDLVAAVAEHADLTKAQAGVAVDAVLEAITATLKNGDEVRLVGSARLLSATARLARPAIPAPAKSSRPKPPRLRNSKPVLL